MLTRVQMRVARCAVGATWRTRLNDLTTFGPKYDMHTECHADVICRFEFLVSGLQD